MATIAQPATASKTAKAFYAWLYDDYGIIAKAQNAILFLNSETGQVVTIEPDMCNFLTVLGELELSESQKAIDAMRGGAAKIACTRAN